MTRNKLLRTALVGTLALGLAGAVTTVVVPAFAASTVYQAESATLSQATVATNHTGFTGSGFVDYNNVSGSFVEFTVNAPSAGTVSLAFRYANGATTDRPLVVTVDGAAGGSLSFPGTGSWNTWQTRSTSVTVTAGNHQVRATATTASGGPNLDSLTVADSAPPPPDDFSVAVVDSEMARLDANHLGSWGYTQGLFLYGTYLVYQRTHNPKYLTYIKAWADRFIQPDGTISQSFNNLDSINAVNVALILNKEFPGDTRYRKVADKARNRLETYSKTSDGGWWHSTTGSRNNQLWGDGVFMVLPFLVRYGDQISNRPFNNDQETAFGEAVKQLKIYYGHLRNPANNLLKHAYDGSPAGQKASWADPVTGRSPETWCRAQGWFTMTLVQVLDVLPPDQPGRQDLVAMLQSLIPAIAGFQNAGDGMWWQVVDKGTVNGNFTETSCSSMYTYMISRSAEKQYVDASFKTVAHDGYHGVLDHRVKKNGSLTDVTEICVGTNVGDLAFYLARPRATNDLHGLGAFLIMSEQLRRTD